MEKGQISAKMVKDAFTSVSSEGGKFFGMMDKQSKTVAGLWSTFTDVIQMKAIGIFDKIQPYLTKFLTYGIAHMDSFIAMLGNVWNAFQPIFSVLGTLIGGLIDVGKWLFGASKSANFMRAAIVGITTAIGLYILATQLASLWTGLLALNIVRSIVVTYLMGGAWSALSIGIGIACKSIGVAIMSIPIIGWIAAIVALLITLGIYFYNTSAKFRAFIDGVWNVIKSVGSLISGYFVGLGKTILGAFSFNLSMFKEGINTLLEVGRNAGQAYTKGYDESIAAGKRKKQLEDFARLKEYTRVGREMTMKDGSKWKWNGSKLVQSEKYDAAMMGGSGMKKSAIGTSELGAKGGLGEAKNITINIETMQKNEVKSISDFKSISTDAIEILTRTLNNLVFSTSATF